MKLSHHPTPLWVLAFSKLWDTFSYFGTQTILALYFMHVFHLDRSTSYLLYGAYAAIAFTSPLLGGLIADRWLGSFPTLVAGSILNIVGNVILISLHRYSFCLGLSLSLIGSGLYNSNATHLVGTLYPSHDGRKEAGFTWYYLATNVGGVLGPLTYGVVAYALNWNWVFLCSALGLSFGLIWTIRERASLKSTELMVVSRGRLGFIVALLILLSLGLSTVLYYPRLLNGFVISLFALGVLYLIIRVRHHPALERKRLWGLLLLCFFAMFYFAAGLQTGSTITSFIQSKIQSGVIQTHLPGNTFNTLYCLFVLLLAPFVTRLWQQLKKRDIQPSVATKVALGIGLAAIGMGIFTLSALSSFVLLGVAIGYLFLSLGELVLMPSAYTAISDGSPVSMKSTMMGSWLLFIAMGGYFSSQLANLSNTISHHWFTLSPYAGEFLSIALFTIAIAIIVALFVPRLGRMMKR